MASRSIFTQIQPYFIGVGLPVACTLGALALPISYDLKGSVGELKGSLTGIQASVARIEEKVDGLSKRATDAETSPAALLLAQGIKVDQNIAIHWISGKAMLFPKTVAAQQELVKAGYQEIKLTPAITAWSAPGSDTSGSAKP